MKESRSELVARVVAENRAHDLAIRSEQRHKARDEHNRRLTEMLNTSYLKWKPLLKDWPEVKWSLT